MSNPGERKESLRALREYLDSLPAGARVRILPHGYGSTPSHCWPWPGPGAARRAVLAQIAAALRGLERASQVEVWPDGEPEGRVALFGWPGQPGLFPGEETVIGPTPPENRELPAVASGGVRLDEPRPAKASEECARDVLHLLFVSQRRLTAEEMQAMFDRNTEYYAWCLSSVTATCTWLRRDVGALDNRADGRGRGFGLKNWTINPCPPE